MKRGFGTMLSHKKIMVFGSVLIYILLFAILLFAVWKDANPENDSSFGSLEGRFRSDIVMMHDGEMVYYRENEITNYLIIGLDRENIDLAAGHQKGDWAVLLVILSADRINRTITPVMLNPDTMIPAQTGHPSDAQVMQLGMAQAHSDDDSSDSVNTVKAVEELLCGVKIDHCITVDISAVALLNDAVGGVEVTLEDDFTEFDPAMTKGSTIRLNGEQAAYFVRGGTNASHMMRQQYMSGFLMQLHQRSEKDRELLAGLMEAISEYMQSDASHFVLLWDLNRYKDYLWQPIFTPEGAYAIDESGLSEFWINEDVLQNQILEMWFGKAEP